FPTRKKKDRVPAVSLSKTTKLQNCPISYGWTSLFQKSLNPYYYETLYFVGTFLFCLSCEWADHLYRCPQSRNDPFTWGKGSGWCRGNRKVFVGHKSQRSVCPNEVKRHQTVTR